MTPLRDGMNLVAKEYVAAQDPAKPGVLLLSRFAGAAEELRDALLTNPWDPEGTARDLERALEMPLEERKERHAKLNAISIRTTTATWAEDFLSALGAAGSAELPSVRPLQELHVRILVRLAPEKVRHHRPLVPAAPLREHLLAPGGAVSGFKSPSCLNRVSTSRESASAHW